MTKPDPSTDGSQTKAGSNGLIALPVKLPHHPVVLEEQERRAADIQRPDIDRAADQRGWGHGPGECRHGCLQARGQGHDAPPLAWMSVRPGQVPCPHVTIY